MSGIADKWRAGVIGHLFTYIKTFKNVSKKTHGGKWTINILRSKHQVNAIHYILKYFQKDSGHGGSCELWHYGLLNIILRISQVKKEECLRFNGWSFSSWSWSRVQRRLSVTWGSGWWWLIRTIMAIVKI